MGEWVLGEVADYYSGRLREHGPVAAGVDWNSEESQDLRFTQLAAIAGSSERFSLNDYGCGYGALADFLAARGIDADYRGCDISPEMIAAARERLGDRATALVGDPAELEPADYTVASGIFNVRLGADIDAWRDHVDATIDRMRELSTAGFAFNMLTSHSDPERMRGDLYYADPAEVLDRCLRCYSRHVALRHDYGLYEFTVHVRLEPS